MTESIDNIADELTQVAIKFGIKKQMATDLTCAILEKLKYYSGGGYLYIPKPSKEQRNREIRKRFNGVNQSQVCEQFEISKSTLYRVVK